MQITIAAMTTALVWFRRYLPGLTSVADKYIHAPWQMSDAEQQQCGVIIGQDYAAPVIDHAQARQRTLDRFGALKDSAGKA